ncbi:hypothetical protein [Neorhizobium sp. T25_27]|uniref:hypothetical protein n=1 Tax=Neorhizobium sp. T25_27 TaxID=2093831 RepID=UPI00155F31F7|nr:hypothetical protein [Neorhizobium sp. T25_27]
MRLAFRLISFAFFALLSSQGVRSEEALLSGRWQQISSDAGSCATCFIGIVKQGTVLVVSANNGWSATVETGRNGPARFAGGQGRWKMRPGTIYSNRVFDVVFALRGEQLAMVMVVDFGNGSKRTVRAVFARPAPKLPMTKA